MKFSSKKGWNSVMPLRLKGKSATRFCMFPKVHTAGQTSSNTPVYLTVYDLTPMNGYVHRAGLGIFHSGVEEDMQSLVRHLQSCVLDGERRQLRSAFSGLSPIFM